MVLGAVFENLCRGLYFVVAVQEACATQNQAVVAEDRGKATGMVDHLCGGDTRGEGGLYQSEK